MSRNVFMDLESLTLQQAVIGTAAFLKGELN